nr:MAG TPA: hypothetical protein [Caudoviricetes sp.]DAU23163.1 MAG TPA: hypothetical protein [Caudoviricetes sp.]DAU88596.1 MAG TPA: hypothetical protein [Caudoviricetes sp.]
MDPNMILKQLLPKVGDQPMINNAVDLMNKGKDDELLKVAQNFCKTQGIDFDSEFKKFMSSPLYYLIRLMHQ